MEQGLGWGLAQTSLCPPGTVWVYWMSVWTGGCGGHREPSNALPGASPSAPGFLEFMDIPERHR